MWRTINIILGGFVAFLGFAFIFVRSILDEIGRASAVTNLTSYVDAILDFSAAHPRIMGDAVPPVLILCGLLVVLLNILPDLVPDLLRQPRLVCVFDDAIPGCVVETDIWTEKDLLFGPIKIPAKCFRVRVTAMNGPIASCSGYVASVEGGPEKWTSEPILLPFAPAIAEDSTTKIIKPGVAEYLNVIAVLETGAVAWAIKDLYKMPSLVGAKPLPAGTSILLTIVVSSGSPGRDRSTSICLRLDLSGHWRAARMTPIR